MIAGAQYLISIRQIFEVENKLRLQSILPLQLSSSEFGKLNVELDNIENIDVDDPDDPILPDDLGAFNIDIELCIEDLESCLPSLTYIVGSCLRKALKRLKCTVCADWGILKKELEIDNPQFETIKNRDRGGLLLPHADIVMVVTLTLVIVQQLISKDNERVFFKCNAQRSVVERLSLNAIEEVGLLVYSLTFLIFMFLFLKI